jgi:succinoglycan biosynthesis protein ExoA
MSGTKMKVLHLVASNFVGGPEKQILRHAIDVRDVGIEVYVGSFRDQPERAEILNEAEQSGLPTYECKSSWKFDLRAVRDLAAFLKRERIQLLCTHGFKANIIGGLSKIIAVVPQIAFCRGWTGETLRVRVYEFVERRALLFADQIVCVSAAQAKILGRTSRLRARITVVHNAASGPVCLASESQRATHKAQLGFPRNALLIGTVGRLSIEKGQRYLVAAAVELLSEFRDVRIVILGEGRERANLEAQIERLGVGKIVQLQGFIKDIGPWFKAFDVLANCSLTEGIPNVILEALAAGTPVVATAVGGVPELIKDQETGLLVPPADPTALAGGLATVLRSPQLRSKFSQAGQMWVRTRFSSAHQQEALLAIYERSVGPAPRTEASASGSGGAAQDCSPVQAVSPCKQARSASMETESLPFVSVVVPVRNEESHLGDVLGDLLSQEYPSERYEILIADGNSTDRTPQIVEDAARISRTPIKLLPNPGQLASAGRNVGVRHSSGELIVFIDGHCHIPNPQFLLDTARFFQSTGADCLCRPQPLTAPGSNWFQRVVADVRASLIGHGLDSTIYSSTLEGFVDPTSSGASYRREVFDRVGPYDERLDACEDVEFNHRVARAGLRAYISPRLTVQYHPRSSLSGLWKQMVRYGRGRYRFNRKHPQAFSVTQVIPALFLLWLLFGSVGSVISARIAQMLLWSTAVYVAVIVASSIALGLRRGWRHAITAPSVYLTIHFGLGYGFLAEAAHALRRKIWRRHPEARANSSVLQDASARCNSTTGCGQELHVQTSKSAAGDLPSTPADKFNPTNAFTVDVEDYFHTEAMASVVPRETWEYMPLRVQNNTRRLFELLGNHNVRGTFFFLGWVAERFPCLVREALELGHEVGCHSFWHRPVHRLTPSEFREDTLRAKRAIEDAGGVRVFGYRAPSFTMVPGTEWALAILAELGFEYDSSVNPVRHDLYGNASAPRVPNRVSGGAILELPIVTTRLGNRNLPIGGGGYLRILPYAYSRWGLRRANQVEGMRGIVYLHPWEIDPEQPRLQAPRKARFRQYVGLSTMERKLDSLLQDFRFAPISSVFQQELLETAPVTQATASLKHAEPQSGRKSQQVANSVVPLGGR